MNDITVNTIAKPPNINNMSYSASTAVFDILPDFPSIIIDVEKDNNNNDNAPDTCKAFSGFNLDNPYMIAANTTVTPSNEIKDFRTFLVFLAYFVTNVNSANMPITLDKAAVAMANCLESINVKPIIAATIKLIATINVISVDFTYLLALAYLVT